MCNIRSCKTVIGKVTEIAEHLCTQIMSPPATAILVCLNCFKQNFKYNVRTAENQTWGNTYFVTETQILSVTFYFLLFLNISKVNGHR